MKIYIYCSWINLRKGNASSATPIKITCTSTCEQKKILPSQNLRVDKSSPPPPPAPKLRGVATPPPPQPPTLAPLISFFIRLLNLNIMNFFYYYEITSK